MAELGIRSRVLVKDVMSSPVVTVYEDETAHRVAQVMNDHDVGCVIVKTRDEKPIGIITERDLVVRVMAKDTRPSEVTAKEIMSAPLITVSPEETLSEAARRMSRLNIRRLGVIYKGDLIGVVSSKDILAVTPELIEIMQEKARIEEGSEELVENPPSAGYCDNCGAWSDNLREVEGNFLCEECRLELKNPEY